MISFILNEHIIRTEMPEGLALLDFIRYHQHLKGTKIGCREGDCGACTVLVGSGKNGKINYQTVTSCLMPLANAAGKHIVSIEGLNLEDLSPVQRAILAENGSQCGFCTAGFVVSLTCFCLQPAGVDVKQTKAAMDGNICRCTGYKSLERAAGRLLQELEFLPQKNALPWLVANKFIPAYFSAIPDQLMALNAEITAETVAISEEKPGLLISGGTDLLVQKPETVQTAKFTSLTHDQYLMGIYLEKARIFIGGSTTVTELGQSPVMQKAIPHLDKFLKLVSSTQIRNMGTVAGNLANASPIGDLTICFLALNATVFLRKRHVTRQIPLKKFYLEYKTLNKEPDEIIEKIAFDVPDQNSYFNFEKVSKRTHLDIASVNTALQLKLENQVIVFAHVAAGGIGPIPQYLVETSAFLTGKQLSDETIVAALTMLQTEISPVSDARGSAKYKRLLLRQLFMAHFIQFFPNLFTAENWL